MVSHNEQEKLMKHYRRELAYGLAVVLKCAACLVFVALIAGIGTSTEVQSDARVAVSAQGPSAQH